MQLSPLTQFVELDGDKRVKLAYSDAGTGQVVLSAHGLTSSRKCTAQLGLTDFGPVGEVARLIAYDARGHGESTGNPIAQEYAWERLADDMLGLADCMSPASPVSAIGLSMGTGTLLHAVLKRPARFDRLVLSAPPTAWETRAAQRRLYRELAQTVEGSSPEEIEQLFANTLTAEIFRDVPGYPPASDVLPALLPSVFRGAALSDLPERERLRSIEQRTLILGWATDSAHPVSTAERLAEVLPHATLHVSETSADIRTWGRRAAEFLARS